MNFLMAHIMAAPVSQSNPNEKTTNPVKPSARSQLSNKKKLKQKINNKMLMITPHRIGSFPILVSIVSGLKVPIGDTLRNFNNGNSANNTEINKPVAIPNNMALHDTSTVTFTGKKSANTANKAN